MTGIEKFDVVVVGAGHAGVHLASELAMHHYSGSVAVIDAEAELPYERPPLTKGFLDGSVTVQQLRFPTNFWDTPSLTAIRGETVVEIDPGRHRVATSSGSICEYGTLVWAAGGHSRRLSIPGEDAPGVHGLRSLADAEFAKKHMSGAEQYVILGGGFIGLEAAAAMRKIGIQVTVVEFLDRLLARVTSPLVSDYFLSLHRAAGVDVRLGSRAERIEVTDGTVSGVILGDGEVLPADGVLVAVGMIPNAGPLVDAGAVCANGVEVDEFGATSLPDIYAVGDCASFPLVYPPFERLRLESVQNAVDQAKNVAEQIANGTRKRYTSMPWFWSNQYETKFKMVGICRAYDNSIVRGDVASGSFSVVYLRGNRVVAIDAINAMRDYAGGRSLVGRVVDLDAIRDPSVSLTVLAKQSK